jgi:hypothetical protein
VDSRGDLVCMVVPDGQVFRADFSQSSGVERCLSQHSLIVSCTYLIVACWLVNCA